MLLCVISFIVLFGNISAQGNLHGEDDCCLNDMCPFDCVRCDGRPTCYDLSDELGCDNKTDAQLRSYPKPPIFTPAVLNMIKQHLLRQKESTASLYPHRTCIRPVKMFGYDSIINRQKGKKETPVWLMLLEKLKAENAPTTTTTQSPVWLQLLQRLRVDALATTTTTTTTPRPTTTVPTTEQTILHIFFEWLRQKQQDKSAVLPTTSTSHDRHQIPVPIRNTTPLHDKRHFESPSPTSQSDIVFTSPDFEAIYSRATAIAATSTTNSSSDYQMSSESTLPGAVMSQTESVTESAPAKSTTDSSTTSQNKLDPLWSKFSTNPTQTHISPTLPVTTSETISTTSRPKEYDTATNIYTGHRNDSFQSTQSDFGYYFETSPLPSKENVTTDFITTLQNEAQNSSSSTNNPITSSSHGLFSSSTASILPNSTHAPTHAQTSVQTKTSEILPDSTTLSSTNTDIMVGWSSDVSTSKAKYSPLLTTEADIFETSTFTTTETPPIVTAQNSTTIQKHISQTALPVDTSSSYPPHWVSNETIATSNDNVTQQTVVAKVSEKDLLTHMLLSTLASASGSSSQFKNTIPSVTTKGFGTNYTHDEIQNQVKLFVDLSELMKTTISLPTKDRYAVTPTAASKTVTSLFTDPTPSEKPPQIVFAKQTRTTETRQPTTNIRYDSRSISKDSNLLGRISVGIENTNDAYPVNTISTQTGTAGSPVNTISTQTGTAGSPVNTISTQTGTAGSPVNTISTQTGTAGYPGTPNRVVQQYVRPTYQHSNGNDVLVNSAQLSSQLPASSPASIVYQPNQLPMTTPGVSWWQPTNPPFNFGSLWSRTTTFSPTTESWWSPSTVSYFWNSLFGIPPTTQRNNMFSGRARNIPVTRSIRHMIQRATPNPVFPTVTEQIPSYIIPTTTPSPIMSNRILASSSNFPQQPTTSSALLSSIFRSTTIPSFNRKPTTTKETITTDGTFPAELTYHTTTPIPPAFSSTYGKDYPIFSFTTMSTPVSDNLQPRGIPITPEKKHIINTSTLQNTSNHVAVINSDREARNISNSSDSSSITSSLEILRDLYSQILSTQQNMESDIRKTEYSGTTDTHQTPMGFAINTTLFDKALDSTTQKYVKPYELTTNHVKPYELTTNHQNKENNPTWWPTPATTNIKVTLPEIGTRGTLVTTGTSFPSTDVNTLVPSTLMTTKVSTLANRMSNRLGVSNPSIYSTVGNVENFVFNPNQYLGNKQSGKQNLIRLETRNPGIYSSEYNISKPELAEWAVTPKTEAIKYSSTPNHSWWSKIISAVTESSLGNGKHNSPNRDTQTVTYNLFQTPSVSLSSRNPDASSAKASITRATTMPYYEFTVTPPTTMPLVSARKDCKLILDGGEYCSDKFPGYYKNPSDCRTFHVCEWSKRFLCHCPPNTKFDDTINVCNWDYNVQC